MLMIGGTALMAAATEGHYDIVKMLLEYGAFMEARSNGGIFNFVIYMKKYLKTHLTSCHNYSIKMKI